MRRIHLVHEVAAIVKDMLSHQLMICWGLFQYFPTLLIVLLAVFNDGAMIALSKDRVVASSTPNVWTLPSIFITGNAPPPAKQVQLKIRESGQVSKTPVLLRGTPSRDSYGSIDLKAPETAGDSKACIVGLTHFLLQPVMLHAPKGPGSLAAYCYQHSQGRVSLVPGYFQLMP